MPWVKIIKTRSPKYVDVLELFDMNSYIFYIGFPNKKIYSKVSDTMIDGNRKEKKIFFPIGIWKVWHFGVIKEDTEMKVSAGYVK